MGPRGFRRRGLVVGAALGASIARRGEANANASQEASAPAGPAEPNVKDELLQLQNLKDDNLITEAEYDAKRKQILG